MPSLRDKRMSIKPKTLCPIPMCLTQLYTWSLPFPRRCLSPWASQCGTPRIPLQTATRETRPLWSGLRNGIPSATKYYCLNVSKPHLAWSSWAPGSHLCGTRCLVDPRMGAILESGCHWCGLAEPWVYKLHRTPPLAPPIPLWLQSPVLCKASLIGQQPCLAVPSPQLIILWVSEFV